MGIISDVFSQLGDWLTDALNSTIGNWIGGILGGLAKDLMANGMFYYNELTKMSVELLKQTPESWNGGIGWSVVTSVNTAFMAVGGSLVMIFWLIGLISMSVDERMNVRFEVMIKEFVKLFAAETLITGSVFILQVFFGLVDKLTGGFVPESNAIQLTIPDDVNGYLTGTTVDVKSGAMCAIIGILFVVGAVAAGGSILYFAYIRFFKVLLIVPYGAIASSTLVGGPSFSHSAANYYKYAVSTVLEAATMLLAIKISAAIISSDAINIVTNETGTNGSTVIQWMFRALIMMFITLGAVKESGQITQRGLGM